MVHRSHHERRRNRNPALESARRTNKDIRRRRAGSTRRKRRSVSCWNEHGRREYLRALPAQGHCFLNIIWLVQGVTRSRQVLPCGRRARAFSRIICLASTGHGNKKARNSLLHIGIDAAFSPTAALLNQGKLCLPESECRGLVRFSARIGRDSMRHPYTHCLLASRRCG